MSRHRCHLKSGTWKRTFHSLEGGSHTDVSHEFAPTYVQFIHPCAFPSDIPEPVRTELRRPGRSV